MFREKYLYFIKAAKAFAKKTKLAFNYITIKLNFLNTLLLQIHIVRVQRMTIKYVHIDDFFLRKQLQMYEQTYIRN